MSKLGLFWAEAEAVRSAAMAAREKRVRVMVKGSCGKRD